MTTKVPGEMLFSDLTLSAGDVLYYNGTNITNLGIGTAGQVLQTNSGATAPEWADASSGGWTWATSQAASGATVTFSGIPSGTTELLHIWEEIDQNSNVSPYGIQLGDSGGLETSGYNGFVAAGGSISARTDRWNVNYSSNTQNAWMVMRIWLDSNTSNLWRMGAYGVNDGIGQLGGTGDKTLSGELTQLAIDITGGGTFDGGNFHLAYK